MRIISIETETRARIEIEGGEFHTYFRYGPDNWNVVMGMTEEPCFDCARLEELYQLKKS